MQKGAVRCKWARKDVLVNFGSGDGCLTVVPWHTKAFHEDVGNILISKVSKGIIVYISSQCDFFEKKRRDMALCVLGWINHTPASGWVFIHTGKGKFVPGDYSVK